MKIYIDARLPWNSGIGRFVGSVVPLLAAKRPNWRFQLGVDSRLDHPVLHDLQVMPNVLLAPTRITPFSLGEQILLEWCVRDNDLTWFTNYWVPLTWRGSFVATVHDLLHLEPDLFPASLVKRTMSRLAFRKLRASAQGLMFVSQFSKQRFAQEFGPARRSAVIRHGVDQRFLAPLATRRDKIALVVSALKAHKNLDMLVEAWRLADLGSDWQLVIVHPGGNLRSSIWQNGPPSVPNVRVLGGISDEELTALYTTAAIFLLPSFYEGFGLPLLEAALSGCRILASTAPALVEVAAGLEVVHLPPEDVSAWRNAIESACVDYDRKECINEAATNQQIASRATWDLAADEILAFLESL